MIDYVKGTLAHKTTDAAVVDLGGMGLRILSTASSLSDIGDVGTDTMMFTELVVREDAMILVGFSTREELEMYRKLVSVNGVGTKVALAILSSMHCRQLAQAIAEKNIKMLSTAQGVGKKTAERIVVELKDRVDFDATIQEPVEVGGNDAFAALMSMGFSRQECVHALQGVDASESLENIIRMALKKLM